jgi:hypothetical protein
VPALEVIKIKVVYNMHDKKVKKIIKQNTGKPSSAKHFRIIQLLGKN